MAVTRAKGVKNKTRVLNPHKEEIKKLFELKLTRTNILKVINTKLEKSISLTAFNYFIFHDDELLRVLKKVIQIS